MLTVMLERSSPSMSSAERVVLAQTRPSNVAITLFEKATSVYVLDMSLPRRIFVKIPPIVIWVLPDSGLFLVTLAIEREERRKMPRLKSVARAV